MVPTATKIIERIAEITGESNAKGNPTISVNVNNIDEAKSTIIRLKGIKQRLKLVKRESAQTQAKIRAVSQYDEANTLLLDLLKQNVSMKQSSSRVLKDNSRKSISFKKHILISLYKQGDFLVDEMVLKIDGLLIQLDEYVKSNK